MTIAKNSPDPEREGLLELLERLIQEVSKKKREFIEGEEGIRFNISRALIRSRKDANISQAQLAERIGVSKSWVSKLEDSNSDHKIESVWKYLKALGAKLELRIYHGDKVLIVNENEVREEKV